MATILIVDDSTDLHQAMSFILELEGHTIKTAASKELLMEELKAATPDVIMLDVQLNGDNGRDICREIKGNTDTSEVPVILMSANDITLKNYEECGATGVIDKPFSLSELTDKIRSVLK
jgi:DNA-binding response OmpR family regulator